MKRKKFVILLLLTLFIFASADEKIKMLQNGLNSYTGCVDSYVYRKGDDPSSVDLNYNDNPYLMTAN